MHNTLEQQRNSSASAERLTCDSAGKLINPLELRLSPFFCSYIFVDIKIFNHPTKNDRSLPRYIS